MRLENASRTGTRAGDQHSHSLLGGSANNPSLHSIHPGSLQAFNHSIASYGYGAAPDGSMFHDTDNEEPPATPSILVPIGKKHTGSLQQGNTRKRSVQDGKLPEVQ